MPLDPFLAGKLRLMADLRYENFGDPEVYARWLEFHEDPTEWVAPDIGIEDTAIDGPHGAIPVRVYRPRSAPAAALLWAHGGGFAGGTLDMAEAHVVAAEICSRADALVVSVDYRLAIDGVRYPVPLDDVQAAWRWLRSEHGETDAMLGPRRRQRGSGTRARDGRVRTRRPYETAGRAPAGLSVRAFPDPGARRPARRGDGPAPADDAVLGG